MHPLQKQEVNRNVITGQEIYFHLCRDRNIMWICLTDSFILHKTCK